MFKSDIEIAKEAKLEKITNIAKKLNIEEDSLECYGFYKAKVNPSINSSKKGKLILVTAINPTPLGEGKTTTSIGIADGMNKLNKKVALALREPSLGPVFGIKGGAAGGGMAQVAPMEEINLHFTGDFHAITCANNLLSAVIDNHLQQGNILSIDPRRIIWRRCMDMNDRALRNVVVGLGGNTNGIPREDGFDITAASEIMAILCLSSDIINLKERLKNIIVAYNYKGEPISCGDLKAEEGMTILLKDAIKPNLVQTLEGTPAFIHGGPFANIAHGCNSIIATNTALNLADYVITEAGFGADLGGEKFLDIKCRIGNLMPSVIVIVATIRALKYNGGVTKQNLVGEDLVALEKGICNLGGHIENLSDVYKLPIIVALNKFYTDTDAEINFVYEYTKSLNVECEISNAWAEGGNGCIKLAEKVIKLTERKNNFEYCYNLEDSIENKIYKIATKIYHAEGVIIADKALKEIRKIEEMGLENLPVCIAKTQYSFSDNPQLLGRPSGFTINVKDVKLRRGAGFVVVLCGEIMLMPGLPKIPNSEKMTIDEKGNIEGLF